MSLFLSIEPLLYVILLVLSVCSFTLAAPIEVTVVADVTEDNYYNFYIYILQIADDVGNVDGGLGKTRVKRNGAGKYSQAASMGPLKVAQLFFSMFRNLFTTDPIGGVHPMSRTIPGPVVQLFKQTIYDMFFPNLNSDH